MASDVEICSTALTNLGADPVSNINPPDDTIRAELCARLYPIARDRVLRAYPWSFANKRITLARIATAPEFEFAFAYQLPSDPFCLRVLKLNDATAKWGIDGRTLVTDLDSVKIKYTARITDTGLFDALFVMALIHLLAALMALSITGETSKRTAEFQLYQDVLNDARTMDSQEQSPQDFDILDLLTVRL